MSDSQFHIFMIVWLLLGISSFAYLIYDKGYLSISDIILSPLFVFVTPIVLFLIYPFIPNIVLWRKR